MDLSALSIAVRQRCNIPTGDAVITSTVMTAIINEAVKFIDSMYDWPWLEAQTSWVTTALSGPAKALSSFAFPVQRIKLIYDTTAGPLGYISPNEFFEYYPDVTNTSGFPRHYTIYANQLIHGPNTTDYTAWVIYIRGSNTLALSTDVPLMPEQYHHGIVEYAAYLVFRTTYQFDKAQDAFRAFQNWMTLTKDNRRRSAGPKRVNARNDW